MAIKITSAIYVNGTNFTPYLVQPIKWGNFLDERLDEMYITLVGTKRKAFQPMDKVELCHTLHNKYRNKTTVKRMYYLVANDKATEEPIGSGHYTHELYCIELTKMLEMYVVDSLTFTNVLARDYLSAELYVRPTVSDPGSGRTFIDDCWRSDVYKTPGSSSAGLDILPLSDVVDKNEYPDSKVTGSEVTVKVYANDELVYNVSESQWDSWVTTGGTTLYGLKGTIRIEYHTEWYRRLPVGDPFYYESVGTYTLQMVENEYPLKRITCTDVINRLCDLATPLYRGETPRFVLDPKDAADFDKIYCPEITMTQSTLRENLQEVGKIVHGEPRLVPYGFETYKITFDRYGGMNKANKPTKYIEKVSEHAIDSYCSSVDSAAQNLVNSLNYAQGVVCEPRADAYKTVRTETQYVRVTDANMIIKTTRPIYKIIKLECGLVKNNTVSAPVDITPFVFEKTIYDTQLSSYSDLYPYSKAYGLYYSIGDDTIGGLNFKLDKPIFPAFENYTIINIIEAVSNVELNTDGDDFYPSLAFRVTYVPYFNVRLTQSKPYIREFKEPAALIYNQSANVIESRAYGENLKGAVARLGNPERSITYWLTSFGQIPAAGDLYDDDYYISTVACEMYGIGIKCTLGLTKNFNRKSAYVGVSSERRLYEVSERAAYDRTTLYKEYIVVGDEETSDDTLLGDGFLSAVKSTFTQAAETARIDKVTAWGGTYSTPTGTTSSRPLPAVELPVVASALGNAIVFIWSYQDNYSAGPMVAYESNGGVSGYYQQDYAYCDFYGKMYYYNFDLSPSTDTETTSIDTQTEIGLELPGIDDNDTPGTSSGVFSTLEYRPYIYRKDSREISQFCAEVEFVTNRKDLIIGSALAARNGLIGAQKEDPVRLYFLPFEVNKFATKITTDLTDVPYFELGGGVTLGERQVRASTESSSLIVYLDYIINGTQFELIEPTTFGNISLGQMFYSTNADSTSSGTTATEIYQNQLIKQGPLAIFYRLMTISPTVDGYRAQINGKQMTINITGTVPACKSWAFITPQYTTTQTVEDDEGNVSEQTYYEGGEVLLACNTPLSAGDTIPPIYFTAVHDPFKRFEIVETHGGSSTTVSGYKYARYDELVDKFFVDDYLDEISPANVEVGDIVFARASYQDSEMGKALAQVTVLSKTSTSITTKTEIIVKK